MSRQKEGPWIFVPEDSRAKIRSIEPGAPLPAVGRIVQVLKDSHGRRPNIHACRRLIKQAALWRGMSDSERIDLLKADKDHYSTLALADTRVVEVIDG